MPRSPAAQHWTPPRSVGGRGAPIVFQPHVDAAGGGLRSARPVDAPTAVPLVATWLTADERLRVDAAGQDRYAAVHFDDLAQLGRALAAHPFGAALVSTVLLARGGRRAGEALAELLRGAPTLPAAALVSAPVELAAVLALGRAGVRAVVDVQRPDGWAALRALVVGSARPDVAQLARRTLAPLVADLTGDVQHFVAALFEAPARVVTVRDLARGLGVLPTTLMSRFFRAALPPPKRYLALARLTRAAYLLRAPAWTVAAVADHLEYSSAQGFSRHLHLVLGMRPSEFRRRYDAPAMLARFGDELLAPHLATLRTFWPLHPGGHAHLAADHPSADGPAAGLGVDGDGVTRRPVRAALVASPVGQ